MQNGESPIQPQLSHAAFDAFQDTKSFEDMQAAVRKYPFMIQAGFIQLVEKTIVQRIPPEQKPALLQRLAALKQLAGK
jgi:hypothetical protein